MNISRTFIALMVIFILSGLIYAQTKYSPEQEKVRDYLQKRFESTYKDFASLHDEFAEFVPLNEGLETELIKSFPMYRFFVAKTYFSHWVLRDNSSSILVVTNAETGDVVGHRWALWYAGYSDSFSRILESVTFESNDDAMAKVKLLARLIVSTARKDREVGDVKIKNKLISVSLENDWKIMEIGLRKRRFKQIRFYDPKVKKYDKSEEKRKKIKKPIQVKPNISFAVKYLHAKGRSHH